MEFKEAIRENMPLLIGLGGPTGSGKTYSALRLAKGLAGDGKIAFIDTESRRGLHYADMFSFDHGEMNPPFRPDTYTEAIEAADKAGYSVIIVDSMSHEHAGEGGLLDWHDEEVERMSGGDYKKAERVKVTAWIKPKASHKRMVQKMLRLSKAHLILCFRAEEKTLVTWTTDEQGRRRQQIIAPAERPIHERWSLITEKNVPFEMTISFIMTPDKPGHPIPVKLQEQHKPMIGDVLDEETGRKLAEWAAGPKASAKPVVKDASEEAPESEERPQDKKDEKDIDVDTLVDNAMSAATKGMAELESFWKRIGPKNQRALEPFKDDIKAAAARVDAAS